jgi:hypothetical protein
MTNAEVAIRGRVLLEKANNFGKNLAHSEDSISAAWIDRWKTRHNIVSEKMYGKSAAIRESDLLLQEWKAIKLRQILDRFSPRDIYNADETGLFWKALPDRTLAFKNERVSSGKLSKERVMCLVCASMAGEKVPLLVIGKYAKPRAFKSANRLPVEYRANRKAWMTSTLFDEWLLRFDKRMGAEKCNVALILGDCAAHSVNTAAVRDVSVYFLPPNTTSKTQPMHAGVIKNLKLHYCSQIVRQRLAPHEEGLSFQFDILDSVRLLRRA